MRVARFTHHMNDADKDDDVDQQDDHRRDDGFVWVLVRRIYTTHIHTTHTQQHEWYARHQQDGRKGVVDFERSAVPFMLLYT